MILWWCALKDVGRNLADVSLQFGCFALIQCRELQDHCLAGEELVNINWCDLCRDHQGSVLRHQMKHWFGGADHGAQGEDLQALDDA